MRLLSSLCCLLLIVSPLRASPLVTQRADGTEIVYYLDPPESESYPIAVILQGSECLRVSDKYRDLIAQLNAEGVGVLRLEKPGLRADTPIGDCPEEYLRLNTLDRRVLDLLTVLGRLRKEPRGWNGRLGLSGGSEGSMVAAISAPMIPETVAVLLLSSGGGDDFCEEVMASIESQMRASGATETQIAEQSEKVRGVWREVTLWPVPGKEWASDGKLGRNTYLWWSHALRQAVYRPLLQVEAPIRVYQGQRDTSMLVNTTRRLRERFEQAGRSNLEIVIYEGEHVPPPEVLVEAMHWLSSQLK